MEENKTAQSGKGEVSEVGTFDFLTDGAIYREGEEK